MAQALQAGKAYRELFSISSFPAELKEGLDEDRRYPNYKAKFVNLGSTDVVHLEFFVADSRRTLLSLVDAKDVDPVFLYVDSADLGSLLRKFFEERWAKAKSVREVLAGAD